MFQNNRTTILSYFLDDIHGYIKIYLYIYGKEWGRAGPLGGVPLIYTMMSKFYKN